MKFVLFCAHSSLVSHLEKEVEWLKGQMINERRRAERAIDELLRVRVQVGPVSLSTPTPEDSEIERLMKTTEFSQAGEIGE